MTTAIPTSPVARPVSAAESGGEALIRTTQDCMIPALYQVQRKRTDTTDTCTLELKPEVRSGLVDVRSSGPGFRPGQFNMLYVHGIGEIPISISGDPQHPESLIHTVRAVGPVSRALCQLKRGDQLGVRGPFGTHWPVEEAVGKDVVIVAGGIGLAPLRPAIYHLLAHREKYGAVVLLYGARTPRDMLYTRELERWRGRFDVEVEVTVDSAPGGWRGNVGVVTKLIPNAGFDPGNAVAMLCGPEVMMRFTVRELQGRGLTDEQIYVSMERNMKCGVGFCGHCQLGPYFACKDGPVFRYDKIAWLFAKREV